MTEEPAPGRAVVRNRTNQVSGWLIVILCAVLWSATDPFLLHRDPFVNPSDELALQGALLVTLGLGLVSVASLTVFSVPYVVFEADLVTVRNPLSEWIVPLEEVEKISNGGWPVLRLRQGRRIVLWGAEQSTYMRWAGKDPLRDHRPHAAPPTQRPRRQRPRRSVPRRSLVLATLWIVAAAMGTAFGGYP